MEENGWVKLHRKFIDWEWYDDIKTFKVFIHLLLTCNHADKKWHGIDIKRGQKLTSIDKLAKETRLTAQTVRTIINRLKSTGELTSKTTNHYSLLTLNNYNTYQETNKQTNNQVTNQQQTTNNKQECKELKNDKKDHDHDQFLPQHNLKKIQELQNSSSYHQEFWITLSLEDRKQIETWIKDFDDKELRRAFEIKYGVRGWTIAKVEKYGMAKFKKAYDAGLNLKEASIYDRAKQFYNILYT